VAAVVCAPIGRDPAGQLLAGLMAGQPRFRQAWAVVVREPPPAGAARALLPVRLAVPGAGILQFRLSSEPFTRDARFRVVYYFPADPTTMRRCAAWAARTDPRKLPGSPAPPSP